MNGVIIILIAIVVLLGAYLIYGRWLTKKWGIDPKAKTPAYTEYDGVDYVPAEKSVVFGHIIAKSYHFRTVIQLSRYTRENIPQGVTFKTPIFVRFFKTFFKKLKFCIVAQKHTLLIGRHLATLKKRLFLKLFYFC